MTTVGLESNPDTYEEAPANYYEYTENGIEIDFEDVPSYTDDVPPLTDILGEDTEEPPSTTPDLLMHESFNATQSREDKDEFVRTLPTSVLTTPLPSPLPNTTGFDVNYTSSSGQITSPSPNTHSGEYMILFYSVLSDFLAMPP